MSKLNSLRAGLCVCLIVTLGVVSAWAGGQITLTKVFPRIITPNGDGANDKAIFVFNNPELLPLSGQIFDINGARVADLKPGGSDPDNMLVWDGKDSGGRTVPGGIYLYQVNLVGANATGTVIVAR